MRKSLIAACIVAGLASPALAHGGEDHHHAEHAHAAPHADHHHVAPHGGQVQTVTPYHIELVTQPKRFVVYLLDGHLKTLPVKGRKGDVVLQVNGKTQRVTLQPVGETFQAPVDQGTSKGYVAVISLVVDGKTYRGRFARPSH